MDRSVSSLNLEDQAKYLEEALHVVRLQSFHMKRCLDGTAGLMDALKHCSTFLSELRTSSLTPKNYYQLYMSIFDELQVLTLYLYQGHVTGTLALADLYELVQYAGNIIPRLYLMFTVGSVYMRVSRDLALELSDLGHCPPVKEIMNDMLEMARGVQHPTRGLFLRYFLSVMCRDYLPDAIDSPFGTYSDSIRFILHNFIEMNKLWVRMQYQGHSRDREKRESERKELCVLVGSNLVRLSQIDLSLDMYVHKVLGSLLEEVVSSRDVIAQNYLMDVIIQVFPDEYHLTTLPQILAATAQLQPMVNVKQIVISIIDRFSNYAARKHDETGGSASSTKKSSIPDELHLFNVFWDQITGLFQARPEFTIEDIMSLLLSLCNLSLSFYPSTLSNIDKIFGLAYEKMLDAKAKGSIDIKLLKVEACVSQLILSPIKAYANDVFTILRFPSASGHSANDVDKIPPHSSQHKHFGGNFSEFLLLQSVPVQKNVAHEIIRTILNSASVSSFRITSPRVIDVLFGEWIHVVINEPTPLYRSQSIQPASSVLLTETEAADSDRTMALMSNEVESSEYFDLHDLIEEQHLFAKLIHVIECPLAEISLLEQTRDYLGEAGPLRLQFIIPALVHHAIKLAYIYKGDLATIFQFIRQTILVLSSAEEESDSDSCEDDIDDSVPLSKQSLHEAGILIKPAESALSLFIAAAQSANAQGEEEFAYEFFAEAMSIYEDAVVRSKSQLSILATILGTLQTLRVFGFENYSTLATKCIVYSNRLLKRVDQSYMTAMCSHLYWFPDKAGHRQEFRSPKRILECLQKAIKTGNSVMDPALNLKCHLFVLEKYIWFYEEEVISITYTSINELISVVQKKVAFLESGGSRTTHAFRKHRRNEINPAAVDQERHPERRLQVIKHFKNLINYIRFKQNAEMEQMFEKSIPGVSDGFGDEKQVGRWGAIDIPSLITLPTSTITS